MTAEGQRVRAVGKVRRAAQAPGRVEAAARFSQPRNNSRAGEDTKTAQSQETDQMHKCMGAPRDEIFSGFLQVTI